MRHARGWGTAGETAGDARMSTVAAVVIGRNEGARLERCLMSLVPQVDQIIYVDSGSSDNSVAFARSLGVGVVELDTTTPFTAARARNAGFETVRDADYVQFVDGDCGVVEYWIEKAQEALDNEPDIAIVTGWRSEIAPDASVYNGMAEVEWHRPAGDIAACGGDMMVRAEVFRAQGGFNAQVIASEDDEFCLRVGQAGHRVVRLPEQMTLHDSNIMHFSEWWKRTIRNGHGFAEVGRMHNPHFKRERQRVWVYGAILPGLFVLTLLLRMWVVSLLILGVYINSWWRTSKGLQQEGLSPWKARHQAVFLTLSKIPNLVGMLTYHKRRMNGADATIIEYK